MKTLKIKSSFPICGAKTRSGGSCQKPPALGKKRCRLHGGAPGSGRPPKHGRWCKILGNLGVKLQEALNDPHLASLEPGIAVFDKRLEMISRRMQDGDVPRFRKEALALYTNARAAMASKDTADSARYLNHLGDLLQRGSEFEHLWDDFLRTIERRNARVEKSLDISLKGQNAINARDLLTILGRMVDIIIAEVPTSAAKIIARIDDEIMGSNKFRAFG